MRGACIDIGSNTTRLLVAECDGTSLRAVHQSRAFTRLGLDMAKDGRISAVKLAELAEVVTGQLREAEAQQAERIRCVATAAVRRAPNAAELVSCVEARCPGLRLEILTAEQEARLAFLGACRTLDRPPTGQLGLVDVGGGSSELVVGDPDGEVRWWTSVPIGSAHLTAEFIHSDPPAASEVARARARVQSALDGVDPPRPELALAVGGSATSLLNLAGDVLAQPALQRALELLTTRSVAELATETGLDAERVRLLPGGLLILAEAARHFGQPLLVGAGGLREGVLLQAAG